MYLFDWCFLTLPFQTLELHSLDRILFNLMNIILKYLIQWIQLNINSFLASSHFWIFTIKYCCCIVIFSCSVQFNSVAQLCPTLCDPMDCSMPGFHVHHQLLELAQTNVHRVGDAIQPPHSLSSPPAFNLSQHQGLFQWVSSSHQVAKVLEFQLQHQSFQWTPRTDLL